MSIRVLIADDQDLVRGALKVLLNLEPDIKVVAELGSGVGVADAVKKYRVDVALLDIEMPDVSGIEAAKTPREIEICNAAKDHASVAQIANRIFLSEGTVRNHLSNVMAKTGARNYHEAIHAAITKGWL